MIRQGTLYHKRAMSVPVFLHALYGAGYGQKTLRLGVQVISVAPKGCARGG